MHASTAQDEKPHSPTREAMRLHGCQLRQFAFPNLPKEFSEQIALLHLLNNSVLRLTGNVLRTGNLTLITAILPFGSLAGPRPVPASTFRIDDLCYFDFA
jgi:hypothetical protein